MNETKMDRNRALLLTLPKCGPDALEQFVGALQFCGENDAVDLLGSDIVNECRCHLDLGGGVFVSAKKWKDEIAIHIRKYDTYQNGKSYPTKRGIMLTLKHWIEFSRVFQQIEEEARSGFYVHLGGGVYATRDDQGVDLRLWESEYWTNGKLVPTAKGILLSFHQWEQLKNCHQIMSDFVPEINDVIPCMLQEDHQNQIGMLMCSFCSPNEYKYWQ